jgi:AraC-like DNA-binding protein
VTYPLEISAAYVRVIAQSQLATPAQLLAGTDIEPEALRQADYLDWHVLARMLHNLDALATGPEWTAQLGATLGLTAHGPLGFAALSAPTLGEALTVLADWYPVRNATFVGAICEREGRFGLVLENRVEDAAYERWVTELVFKVVETLLGTILGHRVGGNVWLDFAHAAPPRAERLIGQFDARVRFAMPVNFASIPVAWRQLPSPLYDEGTYRANLAKCRENLAARGDSREPDAVVRALLEGHFDRVLSGQHTGAPPALGTIAASLHVTPRTLIRRLQRRGTCYKQLLEGVRRDYACRLLRDARLTVADVGERLGYREPANFGRAFRGWFGTTPAAWRRQAP